MFARSSGRPEPDLDITSFAHLDWNPCEEGFLIDHDPIPDGKRNLSILSLGFIGKVNRVG